ncbi:unnamed protein product [Prunus armeniaca]
MASTRPYNYLPGLIIYHILQLLPTKLAAQASFVSKQWAEAWSLIPVFEFKEGDPYNHDGKFRLRMRYQGDAKVLDAWLRSAVERSVKELDISLRNVPTVKPYCLPQTLFDAKLLTTLSLEDVRIEDNADQPISLPSLKSMSFKMVDFEGMALSNLISGCPWIEHLSLNLCDLGSWTSKLKISSSSLKSFEIFDCYSRHIEIEAKNLESFKFDSDFELLESMALFDCTNLKCINIFSQHLQHLILYALCQNSVEATINTPNLNSFDFSGYLMANVSMAPLKYLSDATLILLDHIRGPTFSLPLNHFFTLRDYLEHFDCSKKLKLYIHDAEGVMFPEDFREAFPSPLPNLKHLNIVMNSAVEGIKSALMESLHWMAPSTFWPIDFTIRLRYSIDTLAIRQGTVTKKGGGRRKRENPPAIAVAPIAIAVAPVAIAFAVAPFAPVAIAISDSFGWLICEVGIVEISILCPNILICCGQTQSYLTQIMKMKKPRSTISTSSKIKFEESKSSSSSEDEEEIEQELADVTFGELQKARSNGSHLLHPKPKEEKKGGRANKNRPMEVSCKKPVPRFREIIQGSKKVVRDPRFESLCGTLDVDGFRKRYDFLFANELPAEREELQKQVKKSKDPEVIEELKKHISWIDKQLKSESAKRTEAAILAEHKQKEREAAKQGKQPFFLKKSEIRKKRLMEKYKQLKGSGKLEAFIEKRRRKNAAKDHIYMPYRRPDNTEQQI